MADDLRVLRVGKTYTIVASQTSTATNTGTTAVRLPFILNGVFFLLDVTAQATEVDDTLDVQVQTSLGGTWVDVVAFTRVLGNGTPRKYLSDKVEAAGTQAQTNPADTLGADVVKHVIGDEWRARWTQVDPGAGADSFTFSIIASIQ